MTLSRLYSQVFGYYDFTGNPHVVNPMAVGGGVLDSDIAHVHESTHRMLATSTTTGYLVRLLVEGQEKFPQFMQADVNEVVIHIIEACRMPHEAAATYFSLRSSAASQIDLTLKHISALPQYYCDAVSYFEETIGPILDGGTVADQRVIQAIVMTVARLSLNVPIGGIDGFRDLSDIRSLISDDNPTQRFEWLIDVIKAKRLTPIFCEEISHTLTRYLGDDWRDDVARIPYSEINSHFQEACEHLGQLFLKLDVPFKLVLESQLLAEIEAFGSQPYQPYWDGTVLTKVRNDPDTSEIALNPEHPNLSKDYAVSKKYIPGSVGDIHNAVNDASREGFLFVHIRRPTNASPDTFEILAQRFTDGVRNSRYISCTLEIGKLLMFHDANPERVALKIDERLFRSQGCRQLLMLLDKFSIPIFVLAHETTADRLAGWLEIEQKRLRGDYMVFVQHFAVSDSDTPDIQSLCVAVAGNERDGFQYSTLLLPSEVNKLANMLASSTLGPIYAPTFSSKRCEGTHLHKHFERWAHGEIMLMFLACTYLDDA